MKLFELVGIKAHYDKDTNEVVKLFQSGGKFTKMGQGAFAVTFKDDTDVIYKFWLQDSAYENFIEYALKHQDNEFLPKFKSKIKTLTPFFKRPESFPDKIKYIKMELLTPLQGLFYKGNYSYFDIIKHIIEEAEYGEHKSPDDFIAYIKQRLLFKDFKDDDFDHFKDIYVFIKDMVNNGIKFNDLHRGNMMVRNGNQPVITDPSAKMSELNKMDQLMDLMKDANNLTISGPSRSRTNKTRP